MAAIITDDFRRNQARLLVNDIKASASASFDTPASNSIESTWPYRGNNRYAIGLGKADKWPNDSAGKAEDATGFIVPAVDGTLQEDHDIINNLFTLKDVVAANVKQMIAKNVWTTGRKYKVYDQTDDDMFYTTGDLYPCTVIVGTAIYMCLSNTATSSAFTAVSNSTTTPSASTYGVSSPSSDGYVWAHVANFDANDDLATNQFSPVTDQSQTTTAAEIQRTGGLLTHIGVINGGTGYTSVPTATLTLTTSAGAVISSAAISLTPVLTSGVITRIDIQEVGVTAKAGSHNYWTEEASAFLNSSVANRIAFATVSITGGGGSGATAYASIAPIAGFATNALDVLPTWFVGIYSSFVGSETDGDAPTLKFRQVSLLKNFVKNDSDGVITSAGEGILDCLNTLTLTGANTTALGALTEGTVLTTGTSKFYYNYYSGNTLYYHQNSSSEVNMITPTGSSAAVTVVDGGTEIATGWSAVDITKEYDIFATSSPNKRNGEVIFQENRAPFGRTTTQTEEVKLIIQL